MPAAKKKTSISKRKPKQEAGDHIAVENRGHRNAIAAGRNAVATVFNINIRELKWQPIVIILIIVGALLSAILWFVVPKTPASMSGQFNVAVAEFLVQDANGKTLASADGKQLASYVQQQVKAQFSEIELDKTIPFELWGPKEIGVIRGSTSEERTATAAKLAEKIHAHVLIYGVITSNGSQSRFNPEFYVNYAAFHDASEITGAHELGSNLPVKLPFGNSIQNIPALVGRVNALDLVTIGLAYYSIDDFERAASFFEKAVNTDGWIESKGKEVIYLLLGNAYVRWASMDDDDQYLPSADENYSKALDINPNYGRGLVGHANVVYLESLGSLQDPKVDPAKLEEAAALTEQALALKDQPESTNIPAKAHFNLGQINLARWHAKVPGENWVSCAKEDFTFVTQHYESGDIALESLAAHAYFRLGVIAYIQNDKDTAFALIQKAISFSSPFYQAEYTAYLGKLYAGLGQKDLAQQSFEEALSIAETYNYPKSVERYREELKKLK